MRLSLTIMYNLLLVGMPDNYIQLQLVLNRYRQIGGECGDLAVRVLSLLQDYIALVGLYIRPVKY